MTSFQKHEITVDVVSHLVRREFPEWAHLPLRPVDVDGWDNCTFRLGDELSVRVPSSDAYVAQVDKEHRWLPVLAPQLPLPIPTPIARVDPNEHFPRPWSVYKWLDGDVVTQESVTDLAAFAHDLATFLNALYGCDPTGPEAGAHSFWRGGPVATWDAEVRQAVADLGDSIDAYAVLEVWDSAVGAAPQPRPVWVHGDIASGNLLARDGRLVAVIDFGCSAVGDPACDLVIAWRMLRGESRDIFKATVDVDEAVWTRARGWALWKPLTRLAQERRAGLPSRSRAAGIVAEVLQDHRHG